MSLLQFYRQQAKLQNDAAAKANLPQVRDQCVRAANAWNVLADRAEQIEEAREIRAANDVKKL